MVDRILYLFEDLKDEMIEEGIISDDGYYSSKFDAIRELLLEQIQDKNK